MKTLHPSFRNGIGQNTPSVRVTTTQQGRTRWAPASALGSEKSPLVTPASPLANAKLTNSTEKEEEENAELTGSTGRLPIKGQPQYGRLSTNDQSDGDEEAENDRLFEEWYRRQRDSEPTGTLIIEGSSDDD